MVNISLRQINLSTKQYYSRISGLISAGLIKKQNGKYSLTFLGRIVYDSQLTIGKSLEYYWKLKAIESIEESTSVALPEGELTQLIDALIDNGHIKSILIKSTCVPSTRNISDKPRPTPSHIIEQINTI
jgi:predicted transcriptional regulator